jgi:LPXTG-site transpeptidase (sortase) family protein
MTAGAFLLLKQAVPGRTVEEYKQYLPSISRLSTDRRELITYPYPKKVLNFDGFPEFLNNIKGRIVPDQPFFPIYRLESAGVLPRTGISGRNLPLQAAALNYRDAGMTLQIPVLSLNTGIVEVPYLDGEYPVSELGEKAGLPEGFSLPGNGTTLLIGHNHLGTETAGPFALLYSLQSGDRLFVNTQQEGTLRYEVFVNEKTAESDFASLQRLAGSEENALLLLTCEDERPERGYANRRIVAAKPVR